MDSTTSPERSDDESAAVSPKSLELQDPGSPSDSAKSPVDQSIVKEEDSGDQDDEGETSRSMPVQKRRRVTRACDECRRKKIKCDGKQPCTHCSVYSYECTYDKPSNRRRNPAPQYIEALENKLQRAEALLRKFMPDVDLTDPNLDPVVQQEFQNRERARAQAARSKSEQEPPATDNQDAGIISMIGGMGQLDLMEGGQWDFHGRSSGAVFLRRMREHFRGLLGTDYNAPFLPRPPRPPGMFNLDSPRSSTSSPWDSNLPDIYDLPSKERARTLCYYSLNCATCLLRIVHQPSFYETFDRLYEKPVETFTVEDNRALGLLYSVLALGSMYNISEDNPANPVHYKAAMEEGIKYYTAARMLIQDITECRDLISLQALLYMILFLQATSNLSGCYSFLGIALRAALRMGLHRHLPQVKLTCIELESRRRVFYVIRQMDTYVSALLGFPLLMREEDIDQPLPTEVDDEYITKDGILTPPADATGSFFQAFNAHVRLMGILAKVIKHIYPMKSIEDAASADSMGVYMISYAKIKEIEGELQDWYKQLPIQWRPSPEGPIEVIRGMAASLDRAEIGYLTYPSLSSHGILQMLTSAIYRVRTLLRFAYAHVQMMLYRPFLHYVSPRLSAGKTVDDRYYACAAAAISVSRNIVHIGMETRKQTTLIGPYWFILYTEYFAILALVFYALENPEKQGSAEILADATAGKEVIASLAQRSMAADRVTGALSILFDQLPDQTKKGKGRPIPTKKRSAPGPKAGSLPPQGGPSSLPASLPQRRSDELHRPQSGHTGADHLRHIAHRMSFDNVAQNQARTRQQNFMSNFPDLLPLDMPSTGASSESSGTPTTSHRTVPFMNQGTPTSSANTIYKLDEIMFPSADPFAYPNQPLMGLSPASQVAQSPHLGGGQPQASGQFYMPNMYDDIEGQLMGPVPSYLMQPGHGQHGLDLSQQMYNSTNMLTLQGQPQQHHDPQQRQNRELEEMMADPGFRGNWGDAFGPNYRPI